jgi:hypothetical protein
MRNTAGEGRKQRQENIDTPVIDITKEVIDLT